MVDRLQYNILKQKLKLTFILYIPTYNTSIDNYLQLLRNTSGKEYTYIKVWSIPFRDYIH